ncbi:hypothetical protein F5Y07DRAFT_372524 [Xylaria sp. FL0933]|nr:hypothetical protein F5Y07DRAFT_372524 [Xylaria sp. FL0933]
MDPVTALGLASNIYTFVEVGFKVVRQYRDFRRNHLYETRDNAERRIIAEELRNVSGGLIADGPPSLTVLGGECSGLCNELLELLDKLAIKNPNSTRERIGVIVRSYRRSADITSLENRLSMYRNQLTVNFLQMLRDDQSKFNEKLNTVQHELRQLSDSRSSQLTELRSDLLKTMQLLGHTPAQPHLDTFGQLLLQLRDMVKSCGPEVTILMQLRFNDIYSREDTIKAPTEGTSVWPVPDVAHNVGESARGSNGRENLFAPWLRSGSGIFHVSGKAGSGKSTLMKHIWLHDRTREHLKTWAGNKKLLKAAFFFWAAGNSEQKSLTGLMRSILFTILCHDKTLIPAIFPQCWENGHFRAHSLIGFTRPNAIEDAFQSLLEKATNGEYRICLFIDGLDEYEAADRENYWELAKRLGDWADQSKGDIKLCVGSRPYTEFQDTFRPSEHPSRTQIHLHQLNKSDIEMHCRKMFSSKSEEFPAISERIGQSSEYLVQEIVRRSEGVFLWAVLVVRIILSEAKRGGSHKDLRRKLDETPDDMDKLYAHMLSSLKRSEKELSNRILFAVLTNPFINDMNALCLKWLVDKDTWKSRVSQSELYTTKSAIADIEYVIRHLDIWTQGLVEVVGSEVDSDSYSYSNSDSDFVFDSDSNSESSSLSSSIPFAQLPFFASRVKLFHRTVRDYLLHSVQFSELQSALEGFNPTSLHADLRLTEMRLWSHCGTTSQTDELYQYGYEIVTAKSDLRIGSVGGQIGEYQVAWPLLREMAQILPSRCLVPIFRGLSGYVPLTAGWLDISDHTSQDHLAASMGLNQNDAIERLKRVKSESSPRSLLLSACLSDMYFGDCPLAGKLPISDLVRALLKSGFTAYERVELLNSAGNVEVSKWPDKFASVWMILVSGLVRLDEREYPTAELTELVSILGELMRHETQEEVLFLASNAERYDCFITLEDLVRRSDMIAHGILPELQKYPKYDKGGRSSENEPTWVWESWQGQTFRSISRHLRKLTPEALNSHRGISFLAVVSRTYFLEDGFGGYPCFLLW